MNLVNTSEIVFYFYFRKMLFLIRLHVLLLRIQSTQMFYNRRDHLMNIFNKLLSLENFLFRRDESKINDIIYYVGGLRIVLTRV